MFKWTSSWFFLLIFSLHVVSILIFTRGFLLTRTELPFYSNCTDASLSPCFTHSPNPNPNPNPNSTNEEPQRCWNKPAIDRLVIIVLDALRFDFVAPSSFFKEKKPWMDKLQVLQKMAFKEGASAKIFKAIADPPTTSLQRLKGLTTGGLPTFVDVGNSFGAPAIVEDNLLNQLIQNGKRVVMMGDDTWVQMFPHHFNRSYPFPSFNVKDLHTVDNGCIENLLPSLYEKDWDVLIAHFLGVDHAGHIFGVDSTPMIEKLEQYNDVLEKVIGVLEGQSAPGGFHENTLLLVMGDHGQTLNGDHGGGSAEEVETSMFAMSFRKPHLSMPPELDVPCDLDMANNVCISSIQQLDFAVTVSALLGIPFPFGSIGRVNPELYALAASTWKLEDLEADQCKYELKSQQWLRNYADVLCINSWQVKRYIDIYSASSLIGFSSEDLLHIGDAYAEAERRFRQFKDVPSCKSEDVPLTHALKNQIDAYANFLARVAELARSKWTEFNLEMMGVGFGLMLLSLIVHILVIKRTSEQYGWSAIAFGGSGISSGLVFACFMVFIHAGSLLSNSYILEEGKVANFLLATAGIAKLRSSVTERKGLLEAGVFVLLISIVRFTIEAGLSKQAATSAFLHFDQSWILGINIGHPAWMYLFELLPFIALMFLAYILYNVAISSSLGGTLKVVLVGSAVNYMLIAVQWASESDLFSLPPLIIGKNLVPRIIYAIGLAQLAFLLYNKLSFGNDVIDCRQSLFIRTVAVLSVWSPTVIILSGKPGAFAAVASIIGGYCIISLQNIEVDNKASGIISVNPLSVTEWSLLSLCMFFCTGHWCAFDGLRYGAAFIGFDEFVLVRQAILLTIDTFGFSHFIPIFGLPFLVMKSYTRTKQPPRFLNVQISLVYMMYGLITAITATVTMLCVAIQRRHLMVWGLFAPKFVFDVVGLLLSDVLILLMSHFYSLPSEDDEVQDSFKEK